MFWHIEAIAYGCFDILRLWHNGCLTYWGNSILTLWHIETLTYPPSHATYTVHTQLHIRSAVRDVQSILLILWILQYHSHLFWKSLLGELNTYFCLDNICCCNGPVVIHPDPAPASHIAVSWSSVELMSMRLVHNLLRRMFVFVPKVSMVPGQWAVCPILLVHTPDLVVYMYMYAVV